LHIKTTTSFYNLTHQTLMYLTCVCFFSLALGTAPLTISSLAALTVWLFSGICYREHSVWSKQSWLPPVLLLLLLPWVGMLWSDSPLHKQNFAERSYYWLFPLVAATAIKSEADLRRIVISFIAGMTVTALPILLYSFSLLPSMYFMTRIAAQGYITYSLLLVIAVILLARFFRTTADARHKAAIIAAAVILLLTVTQLSGRSGYLTLLLLSPWIFITMFGAKRFIPVSVALLLAIAALVSSDKFQERIALIPKEIEMHLAGSTAETSVGARLQMWKDAWIIFTKHPLAGAGTAGYKHETSLMHDGKDFNHPHNSYLFVAANYGIVGLLIYSWLAFLTLKRAWLARATLQGHTIMAFMTVIMIGSLTDTSILSVATGIALGFIVGIPTTEQKTCVS